MYWGSLTDGKSRIEFEPKFTSSREVLEFFQKIDHGYKILRTFGDIELELNIPKEISTEIDSDLDKAASRLEKAFADKLMTISGAPNPAIQGDKLKSEISSYRNYCVKVLEEIFEREYTTSNGARITHEDRILYIIKRFSAKHPYALNSLSKYIKKYIESVQNFRMASDVVIFFFQEVRKHEVSMADRSIVRKCLLMLYNSLRDLYASAKEDPRLLDSYIKTSLLLPVRKDTKEKIDELIKLGYSPDAKSLKKYVKHCYRALQKSEHEQKRSFWNSLVGLDDAFYTVMDANIARYLIKASESLGEVEIIFNR